MESRLFSDTIENLTDMSEEPKKRKRGDIGPDGRVFWAYGKSYKNGEQWITRDRFEKYIAERQTPEFKAYLKAYRQTTRYKALKQSTKYKAHQKSYRQTPGYKAYQKSRQQLPEYKSLLSACGKAYRKKKKQQDAAVQFFTLTNAAREISKALETKPANTDEKTRDDNQ